MGHPHERGFLAGAGVQQLGRTAEPSAGFDKAEINSVLPIVRSSPQAWIEILAPIGAGGMGQIYKARDTRLDRIVAIKVLDERFNERFEREARAIAVLNHPNICVQYEIGQWDGSGYLVLEYKVPHLTR
jgi:serine/threonine protein kinase